MILERIVFCIAILAFLGVGIYTIGSAYYLFIAWDNNPKLTKRQGLSMIPIGLRRFGYLSIGVFVGCLILGVALGLIRK